MFSYYKLLSKDEFSGFIVKKNAKTLEEWYWNQETRVWERIGIMMDYLLPFGLRANLYEDLTEVEVNKLTKTA